MAATRYSHLLRPTHLKTRSLASHPYPLPPFSNLRTLPSNGRLTDSLSYAPAEGRRIDAPMIKSQYLQPVHLATRLIIFYSKSGLLDHARHVFDRMPHRSIISWTAMISGYSKRSRSSEALQLFIRMMSTGLLPNQYTLATVLTSCADPSGLQQGRQVHCLAVKSNFESHIFVGSSLLDMYAKAREITDARIVFDLLPERDVVSCTAIISGYAQLGLYEEALEMFRRLSCEGMECNYVTFASLLTALSGLSALDCGKQVHGLTIRRRLPFNVVLQNSLIDAYSKCGSLLYARRVFDKMPERTIISWNAMLVGYGKHGLGREVVELFRSMREERKPDRVTYMAVLSGCSHGGLVDEGLEIFDYMVRDQGVETELAHYACIVDLLGRAGRIDKALDFIRNMSCAPDTATWGSLLGACRLHSNVSVGEFVAQRLLEIEPQNAGNYVTLSNIYAAAGRWEDLTKMRKLMLEKAVMKEPGRSWIDLERIVHTFHSGDRSHPQREEVYARIRELYVKLKDAGYVPDLNCVLHDVDDEQKERILLGHSEKLAIAFGLMHAKQGGVIRITKNLRICVDCHNFAKSVSKGCKREISVRDSNRFHLFVGGTCSCGDYWSRCSITLFKGKHYIPFNLPCSRSAPCSLLKYCSDFATSC